MANRIGPLRRGMSLIEMLLAISILGIMAVVLGSLASTVESSNTYVTQRGAAAQHARVVLGRMERILGEAHASESFPGFAVFAERVNGWDFPDTLVVWHPEEPAADADGLPVFKELVIFCPDPAEPWRLLELRSPNDTRFTPALNDTASWRTELTALKKSATVERVQLTDLLRVGSAGSIDVSGSLRGAVFFHVVHHPSAAEWQQYRNGDLDWGDVAWAQSIHGAQTGLRQSRCTLELQLLPGGGEDRTDPTGERVIPFFGSAAIYHSLKR